MKRDFAAYVRKGGGVYIYHAAENAFVGWKEYEQMVGLSWREARTMAPRFVSAIPVNWCAFPQAKAAAQAMVSAAMYW